MTALTLATGALLVFGSFSSGAPAHTTFGNLKYRADIATADDVDYFKATIMAGEKIAARVQRTKSSQLSPTIDLENANGQSVGVAIRYSKGRAKGQAAVLSWKTIERSGAYTVLVRGTQGTAGAYDVQLRAKQTWASRKKDRGTLTADSTRLTHSFEGMEGAEFSIVLQWGRRDTPARLVSITDPDGQPIADMDRYVKTNSRKIVVKRLPLTGRLGTYTMIVEQQGAGGPGKADGTTKYKFNANVRTPVRTKIRTPIALDTAEPEITDVREPVPAIPGQNVTITGENFSASEGVTVLIGDEEATVRGATETVLEVTMPEGGKDGDTSDITIINSDSQTVSETAYVQVQEDAPPPVVPPVVDPVPGPSTFKWTEFTASADTRKIYVSSSEGNDANDGLSTATPRKTLAAGYAALRDGSPDWLLLKSGDEWNEQLSQDFRKSGRSKSEPLLITSYGTGARPLIDPGTRDGVAGYHSKHVSFVGLHFACRSRDPNSSRFDEQTVSEDTAAVSLAGALEDVLFEDCRFEYFMTNFKLAATNNPATALPNDIRIRRSQFLFAYANIGGPHSQGAYLRKVRNLLIEGNTFDHNGHHPTYKNSVQTKFNHNLYLKEPHDVIVRDNVFARPSNAAIRLAANQYHGVQHALIERNVFVNTQNALIIAGGTEDYTHWDVTVRDNVFTNSGRDFGEVRGGYGVAFASVDGASITGNLFIHKGGGNPGYVVHFNPTFAHRNATFEDNLLYGWQTKIDQNLISVAAPKLENLVMDENVVEPSAAELVDGDASLSAYIESVGGDGSLEWLFSRLRERRKSSWNANYDAAVIVDYLKKALTLR